MKLIEARRNGKTGTWVYRQEAVRDTASAAELIARAAALEELHAKYIALGDPEHSADEGNSSGQLPPDATAEEIRNALAAGCCRKLYLAGKYRRANAGIGIDLRSFEVSVTMSAGLEERAEELAGLLDGPADPETGR